MTSPIKPGMDATLSSNPDVAVARTALGITLYLDDHEHWAHGGAAAALEVFLRHAPVDRLTHFTTSVSDEWTATSPQTHGALVDMLSTSWSRGGVRHLFTFQIVDDIWAPETSFSYREVDASRQERTPTLQITLPTDVPSETLLAITLELGQLCPYWSGVGGYVATYNPWEKPTAFWVQHQWARRFFGLDLQDTDRMAWKARTGLPGTNWLTLLGTPLLEALAVDRGELESERWSHDVAVMPLQRGLLIKAGDSPTLGDTNRLEYPGAYAEVARRLSPWMVAEPPMFVGGFWQNDDTVKWFRRFLAPEDWT